MLGVTAVVNLRTQREMDNRRAVPFGEPAALARGRAVGIGKEPLEELLGRPVTLIWADGPPVQAAPPAKP